MSNNNGNSGWGFIATVLVVVGIAITGCEQGWIKPATDHSAEGIAEITGTTIHAGIPPDYVTAYQTAAENRPPGCPVDAALLAAVGWQETRWGTYGVGPDGRIVGLVGEQGPMQFTAATWHDFGNGDPNNIHDAAMAAMRLLCSVNGNTTERLWRYNQSTEYGRLVQEKEAQLRGAI